MSSDKWSLYAVFDVESKKGMSSSVRTNLLVLTSKKLKNSESLPDKTLAPGLIFTPIVTEFVFNIYNCPNSNSTKGIDCAMITLGDTAHNF